MTTDYSDDRITLSDLGFYGYHGVMAEEATLGQRFFIDLTCGVDLRKAGETDDLNHSVSYADMYDVVKAAFEEKRFKLIEALAHHVSERLFGAFPAIRWIQIRVRKPSAPIPMAAGGAAIELHRRRDDR